MSDLPNKNGDEISIIESSLIENEELVRETLIRRFSKIFILVSVGIPLFLNALKLPINSEKAIIYIPNEIKVVLNFIYNINDEILNTLYFNPLKFGIMTIWSLILIFILDFAFAKWDNDELRELFSLKPLLYLIFYILYWAVFSTILYFILYFWTGYNLINSILNILLRFFIIFYLNSSAKDKINYNRDEIKNMNKSEPISHISSLVQWYKQKRAFSTLFNLSNIGKVSLIMICFYFPLIIPTSREIVIYLTFYTIYMVTFLILIIFNTYALLKKGETLKITLIDFTLLLLIRVYLSTFSLIITN